MNSISILREMGFLTLALIVGACSSDKGDRSGEINRELAQNSLVDEPRSNPDDTRDDIISDIELAAHEKVLTCEDFMEPMDDVDHEECDCHGKSSASRSHSRSKSKSKSQSSSRDKKSHGRSMGKSHGKINGPSCTKRKKARNRVVICHKPDHFRGKSGLMGINLTISANAVDAHLAHGDTLGLCHADDQDKVKEACEEVVDIPTDPNEEPQSPEPPQEPNPTETITPMDPSNPSDPNAPSEPNAPTDPADPNAPPVDDPTQNEPSNNGVDLSN